MKKLTLLMIVIFGLLLSACSSTEPPQDNDPEPTPTTPVEPEKPETPDEPQEDDEPLIPEENFDYSFMDEYYVRLSDEKAENPYISAIQKYFDPMIAIEHPKVEDAFDIYFVELTGKTPRYQFNLHMEDSPGYDLGYPELDGKLVEFNTQLHNIIEEERAVEFEELLTTFDSTLNIMSGFLDKDIEVLKKDLRLARSTMESNEFKSYNYEGDFMDQTDRISGYAQITGFVHGPVDFELISPYSGETIDYLVDLVPLEGDTLTPYFNSAAHLANLIEQNSKYYYMTITQARRLLENNYKFEIETFRGTEEETNLQIITDLIYEGQDGSTLEEDREYSDMFVEEFFGMIPELGLSQESIDKAKRLFSEGMSMDIETANLNLSENELYRLNMIKDNIYNTVKLTFEAWVEDDGTLIADPNQ